MGACYSRKGTGRQNGLCRLRALRADDNLAIADEGIGRDFQVLRGGHALEDATGQVELGTVTRAIETARPTRLDFANGDVKWTKDDLGKGSLMLADGKLIIQSEKGDIVIAAAAPDGFKELARAKVLDQRCWVVPVLANGRIYCKNNVGDLIGLDAGAR